MNKPRFWQRVYLVQAILIILGFFGWSENHAEFTGEAFWVQLWYWMALAAPLIPLCGLLYQVLSGRDLIRGIQIPIFALVLIFGFLLAAAYAAFSGVGVLIATFHGFSLMLAAASGVLVTHSMSLRASFALLLLPTAVAIWSILSMVLVYSGAQIVAGGDPYCLGRNDRSTPITSPLEMRGTQFYSTSSGYKDTSNWYFHGVLVAQRNDGLEAYNWSPRRLRYFKIDNPEALLRNPLVVCTPTD